MTTNPAWETAAFGEPARTRAEVTPEKSRMSHPVTMLSEAGVSIWLDDLSRERLVGGDLARLVRDRHVAGVTTNPTIFARAISPSDAYAEQIQQLIRRPTVASRGRASYWFA